MNYHKCFDDVWIEFWCFDDVFECEMRMNEKGDVIVMKDDDEMKEIKGQTHSWISPQMKVVNVDLQPNKLRQD